MASRGRMEALISTPDTSIETDRDFHIAVLDLLRDLCGGG